MAQLNPVFGVIKLDQGYGAHGFLVRFRDIKTQNWYVAKIFLETLNQEPAFLGVDFDLNGRHRVNKPRRKQVETKLLKTGFVPTTLQVYGPTCTICTQILKQKNHHKSVHDRCQELIQKRIHYHTVMPMMDGNLADLLKHKRFPLTKKLEFFQEIAKISEQLRRQGIMNADLKARNVLYKYQDKQYILAPCDAGGLYHMGEIPAEALRDETLRCIREEDGKRVMHDYDLVEEEGKGGMRRRLPEALQDAKPLWWTGATHVDIYLDLHNVYNNYDLSDVSHRTNQFSLLACLMEIMGIAPPDHGMAADQTVFKQTLAKYPTISAYLAAYVPRTFPKKLLHLIQQIWTISSQWKLYSFDPPHDDGTPVMYIQDIMTAVSHIIDPQHAPPPRKILRRAKLHS